MDLRVAQSTRRTPRRPPHPRGSPLLRQGRRGRKPDRPGAPRRGGRPEEFTFDKLLDALRVCVQTCPLDAHREESGWPCPTMATPFRSARTTRNAFPAHASFLSAQAPRTTLALHRRLVDHSRGSAHTRNARHRQSGRNAVLHRLQRHGGSVRRFFDFIKHEAYLWVLEPGRRTGRGGAGRNAR